MKFMPKMSTPKNGPQQSGRVPVYKYKSISNIIQKSKTSITKYFNQQTISKEFRMFIV